MEQKIRASRRKYHIIYKTTCLVTGRYYIGMHSTDDLEDGYMGSGQVLWKSIKKYGKEQHKFEVMEHLPDREALALREEEIITKDILQDPRCMNLRTGGTGNYPGSPIPELTRQKLSEKGKAAWAEGRNTGMCGKKASAETIAKRVQKLTGKKRTEEQCINLSKGLQAYHSQVDPIVLQERGQRASKTKTERGTHKGGRPKGIPMSDEQKLQQSLKTKGKALSEEHKQNLKGPKLRATCLFCKNETVVGSLTRYHLTCA